MSIGFYDGIMKKTYGLFPVLFASMTCIGIPITLEARIWTDAATNRTLEGDFMEVDGDKVVIKRDNGKTIRVAIERLIEMDKDFIKAQLAGAAEAQGVAPATNQSVEDAARPATGHLTQLTPPVSLVAHPIEGEGKERNAELVVTNDSDKEISSIVLTQFFLSQNGSIGSSVPHTAGFSIGEGESHTIKVSSFFMKDDTASVDAVVTRVEWKDGTMWPTWTGPAPGQEGDAPVVAKMIGVIGEGNRAHPVVALFNKSSKEVSFINYSLAFLDANGKKLGSGGQGYGGPPGWLPAGKGGACVGSSKVPPEGTVDVELKLKAVMFDDETHWMPDKE